MKESKIYQLSLAAISGVLLGFSFPPSPIYSLAYIAVIPFFFLFTKTKSYFPIAIYSYLFLFFFHLITVYWTGGFTIGKDLWMMIAGSALLVVHPIFYLPSILLSFFVKKKLGLNKGLAAFVLFWTSFEYLHSLGEYSFPWLTLGNGQAYDLNQIQIIEYISVYGITLIVLSFNTIAFVLLWNLSRGVWNMKSRTTLWAVSVLIILYFGPRVYGKLSISSERNRSIDSLRVAMIQPNYDPWEKWGEGVEGKWNSYLHQFQEFVERTKELSKDKPDIVIWPETAIPFHILLPRYSQYLGDLLKLSDTLQLPIFTGLPTAEYFNTSNAPATAERIGTSDIFVESYNSAVFIRPHQAIGSIHRKTILVPFAERIPYAETFRFLIEPLKWNVGISNWGKGSDTLVFSFILHNNHQSKFSGMICYESIYPNYVRQFVNQGAKFLIVITNDSWWGNTSGAYQHASFATLRAVETRRWVIQCANGGISLIVDPTGTVRTTTELYSQTQFVYDIGIRSDRTFYVKHGDITGQLCIMVSVIFLVAATLPRKSDGGKYNGINRSSV